MTGGLTNFRPSLTGGKPCSCGSGIERRPQHDARGIFLTFTCRRCHDERMRGFRAEVLEDPAYQADDLGDDEAPP